jgi:putative flippase GtrA
MTHSCTVSWAVSYLLSVWLQHALHLLLVFGAAKGGYWRSLFVMYATYSVSIALSPLVNAGLINYLHTSHTLAWFGTVASTGILNYFTVSAAMSGSSADQTKRS